MEKFLLLSCCAPCSCAVVKTLAEQGADFEVVFYNPNIVPIDEYRKRCDENKKLCERYHVSFVELEYDHERWTRLIKGLENEPERGRRCSICFEMRLKRVMDYAKEKNIGTVASVLGVSRYKNLSQVNQAADRASSLTGITYIHIEGRKKGMQELRLSLIKEEGLYEQSYCGCQVKTR